MFPFELLEQGHVLLLDHTGLVNMESDKQTKDMLEITNDFTEDPPSTSVQLTFVACSSCDIEKATPPNLIKIVSCKDVCVQVLC